MSEQETLVSSSEKQEKPAWIALKPADVEKLVLLLYDEGNTPAKIGLILRDKHGIPKAKLFGKRITHILAQAARTVKHEQYTAEEKVKKLKTHITKHTHDQSARRSLMKKRWLISKLSKL